MFHKKLFPFLFVLLFATTSFGQTDLRQSEAFFQKQSYKYEQWLQDEGFSTLNFHSIKTTEDRLSVFLGFPFEATDSTTAAWRQLKRDFEGKSTFLLEEQLFYKAVQLMALGQDSLDIQLYDVNGMEGGPICFFRGIYFEDGGVQVDSSFFGDCRPVERDIELLPSDFSAMQKSSVAELKKWLPRPRLFDAILGYSRKRFERSKTECSDRNPKLDLFENRRHLRFEIKDLCKEVLRDEENSLWCGIVSWLSNSDCNWRRREMLAFTFSYEAGDTGINLTCRVEGKIGSGVFSRLEDSAYYDMEKDFKLLLEKYADRFMVELLEELKLQFKE